MNGVTCRARAASLDDAGVLVVADVHVGRGESSRVSFPLGERSDLRERLDALLAHFRPDEVVLAGDVVHDFDGVSERARSALAGLAEACRGAGAEPVLVAGNHDAALPSAWDGPLRDEYVVDADGTTTVVTHGHEPPETDADRYVVGHLHPTIEIEGDRRPCFLYGESAYRGADLLVVPAFNRLAPGFPVNGADAGALDSPLVGDLDRLEPIVYDAASQETLRFPPLGEFRGML